MGRLPDYNLDPPEDDEPEMSLDFEPPFDDDDDEPVEDRDCDYWRSLE